MAETRKSVSAGRNGSTAARKTAPAGRSSAAEDRPLTAEELAARRERSRRRALARSRKRFRRFLRNYTIVFLLLGAAGLAILYKYLDSYEQGRGAYVMEEYLADKTEEDFRSLLLSGQVLELSEYEDASAVLSAYFDASCSGKPLSYRETAGAGSELAPVYSVKLGSSEVARVTLSPVGDLPFGFHRWQIAEIAPYLSPYALTATRIRVEAPDDEQVFLNGVALSPELLTGEDIACGSLSALESRYAQPPHRVRYELDGLYGDLTLTDGAGSEIYPTEEDGVLCYRLGGEGGYSFRIQAPAAAQVSVCGVPLTDSEISSCSADPLAGLEKYTGGVSGADVTYAASGLYRRPEILVTAPDGSPLTCTEGADGVPVYSFPNNEALQSQMQEVVARFFEANMSYGAGNQSALLPLLQQTLYGSELYSYFSNSTAAMIWASDTTIDYEYLNYDRFVSHSEDCFSCRVSYKANLSSTSWYQTTQSTLEDAYDLVFVRHNGVWLAAAMSIVE